MKPIRSGFDGLEFSIKTNIPKELAETLSRIKGHASVIHGEIQIGVGEEWISIRETGARGGYAFSCREDTTGDWFFKKPSAHDPWGIRFSASSSALVLLGLEGLRLRVAELLFNLGIDAPLSAYSPSRVDFAVDFLAPDFEVFTKNFVVHSRTSQKSFDTIDVIQVNGRSSWTTSVTVGKMPHRQVIIYDKREEVVVKRKHEWASIWARAMNGSDAMPLDLSDRSTSQVWRVELRVAKRHLKDVWDINSWASLYELLPKVFETMMTDIRYCEPSNDTNRARWSNHAIWNAVKLAVQDNLFDHVPTLAPEEYVEIKREQKIYELQTQMLGLAISLAAIEGTPAFIFGKFLETTAQRLEAKSRYGKPDLTERLKKAKDKYRFLVP